MAAVYVEQKDKIKRAKRFMVVGLPENANSTNDNDNDREAIAELCHSELKIMPDIVNAQRVGQPRENKPRLVQVTLKSEEQAKMVIHCAKQLRRSRNDNTAEGTFLSILTTRKLRLVPTTRFDRRNGRRKQWLH